MEIASSLGIVGTKEAVEVAIEVLGMGWGNSVAIEELEASLDLEEVADLESGMDPVAGTAMDWGLGMDP